MNDQSLPLFIDQEEKIQKATTYSELRDIIRIFCSFFDYGLIEELITELGSNNDKKQMKNYKTNFAKRRLEECPSIIDVQYTSRSNMTVCVLVSRYGRHSLSQLHDFCSDMSEILRVYPRTLQLCRVEDGIVLTFQVSKSVQNAIFPLSYEQEECLYRKLHVTQMKCGDYCMQLEMPGKPKAVSISYNSIQLEWMKPVKGDHDITSYTVLYSSKNDLPDQWKRLKLSGLNENILIEGLEEKTELVFKVKAEFKLGNEKESYVSDPIITESIPPSKSGKPTCTSVTCKSIQLEWTKPEYGAHNVSSYTVSYHNPLTDSTQATDQRWIQMTVESTHVVINDLQSNTVYLFKVCLEGPQGSGPESDVSDPIETKEILADYMQRMSTIITSEDPDGVKIYHLSTNCG